MAATVFAKFSSTLGRSVERQGASSPTCAQGTGSGRGLLLSIDLKVQRTAERRSPGIACGGGARSEQRRRDRARQPAGLRSDMFGRGITASEYGVLQSDIDHPLFNRALRGTYPGLDVKP